MTATGDCEAGVTPQPQPAKSPVSNAIDKLVSRHGLADVL